jgi:putative transposase
MDVFFSDDDRTEYLKHLAEQGKRCGVSFLAWCLMSNHVHLIAIPDQETSLARGIGEAHRRYTRYVNFREGWRGYLFQGRFHSFPLEGSYLLAAVRYVLRNPVRAGITKKPWDYQWSSAKWFVGEIEEDPLSIRSDMLADITDRRSFLLQNDEHLPIFRKHARTGRPLGSRSFLEHLEQLTARCFLPRKPGPKPSR